jgi:hypothetical protein
MRPTHRLWLLTAAIVMILVGLVMSAGPAYAQVSPTGDVSPDAPVSAYLTINNFLVLLATGAVIPVLNGLVVRPENPEWVKALLANVWAVVVHAFMQAIQDDGTAVLSQEWFVGLALTVVGMVASYLNVWKPIANVNATTPTVVPIGDVLARRAGPSARAA